MESMDTVIAAYEEKRRLERNSRLELNEGEGIFARLRRLEGLNVQERLQAQNLASVCGKMLQTV